MKVINQKYWNLLSKNLQYVVQDLDKEITQRDLFYDNAYEEDVNYYFYDVADCNHVDCLGGCTKVCFRDDNCDYVIKLPLYYYLNNEDEEVCEDRFDRIDDFINRENKIRKNY